MAGQAPSWRGRRIDALTSLRFFAAMGIVLGHFHGTLPLTAHHATQAFFLLAGSTVALFFVLSGFVLTLRYDALLAQPNPATVKRYALARLARLAPTYWLVLLLTLLAYLGTDYVLALGGDAQTPGKTASFVINLLALQDWVPSVTVQQLWNAPGWSISAGLFVDALLPLLLRARWLVPLGDSSYALYLIHWLPLGFVLCGYLGAPTPWLGPGGIVALVLASVLLHRCVEVPLRRWVMRRASPSTNTP